jgi:hypothetical protein
MVQIEARLNGHHVCTAGLTSKGHLSAHLNLARGADDESVLRLTGIETHEIESVYLEGPATRLTPGDSVTLTLVSEKPLSAPASIRKSSESPSNLLNHLRSAEQVVAACETFERELERILEAVGREDTAEERRKLGRAVGAVMAELGVSLLHPVYRNHPSLVPDQLRGDIL